MNERKVVSLEEAKKRRGNRKASTPPRQKAQRATSSARSSWGRKIFHVVQVVLFLIILSLFVKLCHGGSI